MARDFGATGSITCALGNVPATLGNISAAAIIVTGVVNTDTTVLNVRQSAGVEWLYGWSTLSKARVYDGTTLRTSSTSLVANTPYILGVSKTSGTTTPRFHWLSLIAGSSWVHENASGTLTDGTATTPSVYLGAFGGSADRLKGPLQQAAIWNRVLTDAEFEALSYGLTAWHASLPSALWMLDQAAVTQAVLDSRGGGANQTAITATTISAVSVPSLSYDHPVLMTREPTAAVGGAAGPRDLLLLGAG